MKSNRKDKAQVIQLGKFKKLEWTEPKSEEVKRRSDTKHKKATP